MYDAGGVLQRFAKDFLGGRCLNRRAAPTMTTAGSARPTNDQNGLSLQHLPKSKSRHLYAWRHVEGRVLLKLTDLPGAQQPGPVRDAIFCA